METIITKKAITRERLMSQNMAFKGRNRRKRKQKEKDEN